jgi:hypothetical protein
MNAMGLDPARAITERPAIRGGKLAGRIAASLRREWELITRGCCLRVAAPDGTRCPPSGPR